jgi:DNA-binding NarL/FixJ family response regulator
LIDDHEVIWSGMRGVVGRLAGQLRPELPFEWHCARDLREALAVEAAALDLILLDYHLPDCDCVSALHALRERHDAAPIVVVSGDLQPERIRRTIEAGAAGYVPKAMPEADMVAALALAPDATIADLGAGTGYFAVRLARAMVGVLAQDHQPHRGQWREFQRTKRLRRVDGGTGGEPAAQEVAQLPARGTGGKGVAHWPPVGRRAPLRQISIHQPAAGLRLQCQTGLKPAIHLRELLLNL